MTDGAEGVGPGKYDPECEHAREATEGAGVILIVLGGNKGDGFSASFAGLRGAEAMLSIPSVLRQCADQIERSGPAALALVVE